MTIPILIYSFLVLGTAIISYTIGYLYATSREDYLDMKTTLQSQLYEELIRRGEATPPTTVSHIFTDAPATYDHHNGNDNQVYVDHQQTSRESRGAVMRYPTPKEARRQREIDQESRHQQYIDDIPNMLSKHGRRGTMRYSTNQPI